MTKTIFAALALILATTGLAQATAATQLDEPGYRTNQDTDKQDARRKKRVPGGSGCDDADDYAEHAECRG